MKRIRIFALAAVVAALVLALPATALANSLDGGTGTVTYTTDGKLVEEYPSGGFDFSGLQPGDDITLSVVLKHENSEAGDWYMSNEVVKSLGGDNNSAYSYVLTFEGPSASRTLYDSSKVGGDDSSEGLKEVNDGLKDYFYLDGLTKGQTATVKLTVTLDGETESNAYFNTLANLKMKFAVDPQSTTTVTKKNVVKTGDETDLFPFYIAMAASGVLLLGIGVASLRRRKGAHEGGAR